MFKLELEFGYGNLYFLPGLTLPDSRLSDDVIGYEEQSDEGEKFQIHLFSSGVSSCMFENVKQSSYALRCSVVTFQYPKKREAAK
jgi:hypothetical protein